MNAVIVQGIATFNLGLGFFGTRLFVQSGKRPFRLGHEEAMPCGRLEDGVSKCPCQTEQGQRTVG
eukprot:12291301-Prorocentrum_lima.AAC.1